MVTDLAARIGSRVAEEPTGSADASAPSAAADSAADTDAAVAPAPEPIPLAARPAATPPAPASPAPSGNASPYASGVRGGEPAPRFAPPGPGEIDLVVAPLPFADDRHQFESAIRRLPGVLETTGLYHRRGVYRMRVVYRGDGRLSQQIRALRGFRVRVLAEDRKLVQALIEPDTLAPA